MTRIEQAYLDGFIKAAKVDTHKKKNRWLGPAVVLGSLGLGGGLAYYNYKKHQASNSLYPGLVNSSTQPTTDPVQADRLFQEGDLSFKTRFTPRVVANNIYGNRADEVINKAKSYVKDHPDWGGLVDHKLIDKPFTMYASPDASDLDSVPYFKKLEQISNRYDNGVRTGLVGAFDPDSRKGFVDTPLLNTLGTHDQIRHIIDHEFLSHGIQNPKAFQDYKTLTDKWTDRAAVPGETINSVIANIPANEQVQAMQPGVYSSFTNMLRKASVPDISPQDTKNYMQAFAASNKIEMEPRLAHLKRFIFQNSMHNPGGGTIIDSPEKARAAIQDLMNGPQQENDEIQAIKTMIENSPNDTERAKLIESISKLMPGLVRNQTGSNFGGYG